ncbi:MAG: preprotein translocase subunit SecG [Candidatus Melainabacteria bacterium]|jgi:preprotein translocase subunit SecG|nr:preprotein translocase subunit SecG [Candidatus Melainabacteria bacterium]
MPLNALQGDVPTWVATVRVVLLGVQVLTSVLLILLILLHSPKSDGVSIGGAAGNLFSSQRGAEASLNNLTYWMAGIFLSTSFVLGYYF